MPLSLRRTGLSPPAYRDWLDYVIVEDGRDMGRVYRDRHNRPELRWFWSISDLRHSQARHHDQRARVKLEEAKAPLLANWQRCYAASGTRGREV